MFRLASLHRARSLQETLHHISGNQTLQQVVNAPKAAPLRFLHASYPVFGGRKTGGSAFVAEPRDFSKKQKQRWRKDNERKEASRSGAKAPKLSDEMLKKQFGGEDMKNFIAETRLAMADVVRDLMLPESRSAILSNQHDGELVAGLPGTRTAPQDSEKRLYDESWRTDMEEELAAGHRDSHGNSAYEALVEQIMQVEPRDVLQALTSGESGDVIDGKLAAGNAGAIACSTGERTEETALAERVPSAHARSLTHPATMAIAVVRCLTDNDPRLARELLIEARKHQQEVEISGAKGPHSILTKSSSKPAQDYLEKLLAGFCVQQMKAMGFKFEHQKMQTMFNNILAADIEPDSDLWEWFVYAQANTLYIDTEENAKKALVPITRADGKFTNKPVKRGTAHYKDVTEAIATIDRLKALGVPLTIHMFNSVLSILIKDGHHDESLNWWLRMHREPGLKLNEDSFAYMLKHATATRNHERAFWYMDEMKAVDIKPTLRIYNKLLRACAEAPVWVRGFEDTIFEAMAMMEGAEIEPNILSYQHIITAFGRAGDSRAAEYYFWEMKSKGLKPNLTCTNALLQAFGKAQQVGASEFAIAGRYAPKADRQMLRPGGQDLTDVEKAHLELGAKQVSKLISQGIHFEGDGDDKRNARGGKYNRGGKLVDMLDDDDSREAVQDQLRLEAKETVEKYGTLRDQMIRDGELPAPRGHVVPGALPAGKPAPTVQTKQLKSRYSDDDDGSDNEAEQGEDEYDEYDEEFDEMQNQQGLAELAADDPELAALLKEMGLSETAFNLNDDSKAMLEKLEREEIEEQAKLDEMLHSRGDRNYVPEAGEDEEEDDEYADYEDMEMGENVDAEEDERKESLRQRETWDSHHSSSSSIELWKQWEDPYPSERASYKREQRKLKKAEDAQNGKSPHAPSFFNFINEANENSQDGGANGLHSALSLLDGSAPKGLFAGADGSYREADEYIDEQWDKIEFGRAPPANYLYNRPERQLRQYENRLRAKLLFDEVTAWMGAPPFLLTHEANAIINRGEELPEGVDLPDQWKTKEAGQEVQRKGGGVHSADISDELARPWRSDMTVVSPPEPNKELGQQLPTSETMNALLSVYSECLRQHDAIAVLKAFPKFGVKPTKRTFQAILRMYIRRKDINSALALKEDMQSRVLGEVIHPDASSFGMLINTRTHRGDLPEALNLLEEATKLNLRINERHLKMLRARCVALGVKHPNMPADPELWLKKIKVAKRSVGGTQRRIEPVRSMLYSK